MSTPAQQYAADVLGREELSPHLLRLTLGGDGLAGFTSTGTPDEWVGLVVPGQYQSRYYTVRSWDGAQLVLDVVVHEEGLVTEWATGDPVGDRVTISQPKGSFTMPTGASWLLLVGDLTALPAMARISETHGDAVPTTIFAEADDAADLTSYLPEGTTWSTPGEQGSCLAEIVEGLDWPAGEGYFWMAGESAQMRAIRKHLMRVRKLPSASYDVMGYWRAQARQPRSVDPGPIWRAGKAAGKSDEEIWADYDAAQEGQARR